MAKAVEAGVPKLRIEECAARRQARIDNASGRGSWLFFLFLFFKHLFYFSIYIEIFQCISDIIFNTPPI